MEIKVGDQIQYTITGHSEINGAAIPEGSTIVVTGNNPEVAVPESPLDPVAAGGEMSRTVPVRVLGPGTVDWHTVVTDPQGIVYEATDTLIVSATEPGFVRITAAFEPINPVVQPV